MKGLETRIDRNALEPFVASMLPIVVDTTIEYMRTNPPPAVALEDDQLRADLELLRAEH